MQYNNHGSTAKIEFGVTITQFLNAFITLFISMASNASCKAIKARTKYIFLFPDKLEEGCWCHFAINFFFLC